MLLDQPSPGQPCSLRSPEPGSSKQPNRPVCPAGPGASLWELSVALRYGGGHSLKDTSERSELSRPFSPSAHHMTHRIPQTWGSSRERFQAPPLPRAQRRPSQRRWVEVWSSIGRSPGTAHLKASGVDDFIADGALHEHEVKLAFFLFYCVLFPRLAAH